MAKYQDKRNRNGTRNIIKVLQIKMPCSVRLSPQKNKKKQSCKEFIALTKVG